MSDTIVLDTDDLTVIELEDDINMTIDYGERETVVTISTDDDA